MDQNGPCHDPCQLSPCSERVVVWWMDAVGRNLSLSVLEPEADFPEPRRAKARGRPSRTLARQSPRPTEISARWSPEPKPDQNLGAPKPEAGRNLGAPEPEVRGWSEPWRAGARGRPEPWHAGARSPSPARMPAGTLARRSWTSRLRTWRGAEVPAGRSTNKHNNQTGRQDLRKRAWWTEDATESA